MIDEDEEEEMEEFLAMDDDAHQHNGHHMNGNGNLNQSSDHIIIPNEKILSELDYDDIIDDALYDDDLEEIQIEPDIIDYEDDGSGNGGMGKKAATPTLAQLTPTLFLSPSSSSSASPPQQQPSATSTPLASPQITLPNKPVLPINSKTLFSCSFCQHKFQDQQDFIGHLCSCHAVSVNPSPEDFIKGYVPVDESEHPGFTVACLYCGKLFEKEKQMRIHKNVHLDENTYNCRFCNKIFSDFKIFEDHVKTHDQAAAVTAHPNIVISQVSTQHHANHQLISSQQVHTTMKCDHCNAPFTDSGVPAPGSPSKRRVGSSRRWTISSDVEVGLARAEAAIACCSTAMTRSALAICAARAPSRRR